MKKVVMVMAAVAVVALTGVGWAASNTTLTVSANVVGTCKFSGPNPTLAFGALDPSQNTEKNATVDVEFWCTKGVPAPTFSAADGIATGTTRYMLHTVDSAETIPYTIDSFTPDGNLNLGPGTPRKVTIAGTVPAGSYANKKFGDYLNTVIIEINP